MGQFVLGIAPYVSLIPLIFYIFRLQRWLDMHQVEHQILLDDYMQRKGIKTLPTRPRKW